MSKIEHITVDLSDEQFDQVDRLVSSGQYASASDVVRAGLDALLEHDRAVEHWLRTEVVETYDKMESDPNRGIPLDAIRAEFAERGKARRKDAA